MCSPARRVSASGNRRSSAEPEGNAAAATGSATQRARRLHRPGARANRAPVSVARRGRSRALGRRHPRAHERRFQRQVLGDAIVQILTNDTRWDLREHVSQLADQPVLAFGGADVRSGDVVLHVEARERMSASDELAGRSLGPLAAAPQPGRGRPEARRRVPRVRLAGRVRRRAIRPVSRIARIPHLRRWEFPTLWAAGEGGSQGVDGVAVARMR